jgi:hypothetical protein
LHDGSQKNGGQARSLLGCLEAPDMGSMRAALLFAVLAAPAVLPGCAVEAEPPAVGGYATIYAAEVPPDIYAYPHVYYEGRYAYLVGDEWYYPYADSWVLLRSEPPALYRYRVGYGPSRYFGRYYGAYPSRYYRQPGVNVAPPALHYGRPPLPPPAHRVR